MPLFTFFFEYDGGTYIDQVSADDFQGAANTWAEGFGLHAESGYEKFFEKGFHENLIRSVHFNVPVAIDGISNTWCASSIYLSRRATIHFTQTEE